MELLNYVILVLHVLLQHLEKFTLIMLLQDGIEHRNCWLVIQNMEGL